MFLPVQERHGHNGESPVKSQGDDEGIPASLLCGKAERAEPERGEREETWGRLINVDVNPWSQPEEKM